MNNSKPKFTPGPWRIGDAGHAIFGPPGSGMYPNAPITIIQNLANKANASLIAAAPLLYATLEKVLESPGETGGSMLNLKTAEMIWAALRQARGEK